MRRRALGAFLPFAAFWLYGARSAIVKQAVLRDRGGGDAGPMEAVLLYALLTFLCCGAVVLREAARGRTSALRDARTAGWVSLRGVCGALSLACAFYGVAHIPLSTNALIQNSSVFVTALLAWALLGEAFTAETAAFCALGYAGLALCVGGSMAASGGGERLGYAVSSASLVLDALVYVAIRKARHVGAVETVFANSIFCLLLCGLWFSRHPFHRPQSEAAWTAFGAAAVAGLGANLLFTEALRRASSSVAVATAKYTAPVFLAAVGWVLFSESMSALELFGYGLALTAGVATQFPGLVSSGEPRSHAAAA